MSYAVIKTGGKQFVVTKGRTVQIARGAGGGFSVVGQVNGARISMVLDTGASAVVLTHEAARAAGLPLEVAIEGISVDKAHTGLHDAVKTALLSMISDGKYMQILTKWGVVDSGITADEVNSGKL